MAVKPLPIVYLVCDKCETPYTSHSSILEPRCPNCQSGKVKGLSYSEAKRKHKEYHDRSSDH